MADFSYLSKAGNVVECYGAVEDNSNFEVICEDEWNDWVCMDCDARTWAKVVRYIEDRTPDFLEVHAI